MTTELSDSDRALLAEAAESPAHRWSLRKVGRLDGEDEVGGDLTDHEFLAQVAETCGDIAFDEVAREGAGPQAVEDSQRARLCRDLLAASAALADPNGSVASRRRGAETLLVFTEDQLPPLE
jgi:hypothetical protein